MITQTHGINLEVVADGAVNILLEEFIGFTSEGERTYQIVIVNQEGQQIFQLDVRANDINLVRL